MIFSSQQGSDDIAPGLSIIHGNHLENLRQVAVQWIGAHPLRPLENELFMVQSNGMAQWLKLALAETDGCGIAAAVAFQLPARFLWLAYRAVLGTAAIALFSPFDKERLTWRLMRLLPDLRADARFERLSQFLAEDADRQKCYQLACQLADVFDQYQVYRADWLQDWARGRDHWRNARGETENLPAEQVWQAELWRRILDDVPQAQRETSRAALHRRFLRETANLPTRPPGLPRRVIVFGICSMPQQALEALHAVSRLSQVLLFVHNPCRHYWADIIEDRQLLKIEQARHGVKAGLPADPDPALLHQHVNPLLASWGKQGRDYIGMLYGYDQPDAYCRQFAEIDLFADFVSPDRSASLLQQVQQAILDLQSLPATGDQKPVLAPQDRSITFQPAHSRQREVEILHDHLLSFFESIPGLEPRDIIVMAPDIDAYAPHIEAVFGNLPATDARHIPYAIADRPDSAGIPLMAALETLLHLPQLRMTVSDMAALLEVPAFRHRFGLAEADLPRLHAWIQGAGVRWGLSAAQRHAFDLPDNLDQNTWQFGLRRMLLGYAAGSGAPWHDIEPYDEIGGLEAALVGPLADMVAALEKHEQRLCRQYTPVQWRWQLFDLIADFFLPVDSRDQLTLHRLEDAMAQWLGACEDARLDVDLPLAVVRDALLSAMTEASLSQRFLAGRVNCCTLMPMRAIPFKVVCLLGMNDGQYPRSRPPLDFDLMAAAGQYRPGDRSRREDDRYLFLEALLSARHTLYISYIGRDVRDNSLRMPSVLVGQLRDYLEAGWRGADGDSVLSQLTCQHPLQPFSPTYFMADDCADDLFTYAREWRGVLNSPVAAPAAAELPPATIDSALGLVDLVRFMKNPVQYFFNQRLRIYFEEMAAAAEDHEPFSLDPLAPFGLGRQLLDAALAAGAAPDLNAPEICAARQRRAGQLPMAAFGELAARRLTEPVAKMLAHHQQLRQRRPRPVQAIEIQLPVTLDSGETIVLQDWLDGLYASEFSDVAPARWNFYPLDLFKDEKISKPHALVSTWIYHVAGCAQGMDLTSFLVAPDGVAQFCRLPTIQAEQELKTILTGLHEGLTRPLPVTAKTALAFIDKASVDPGGNMAAAREAARKAYDGVFNYTGECGYSVYLQRIYPTFDYLWQAGDNRFQSLAHTLYGPLMRAVEERQLP